MVSRDWTWLLIIIMELYKLFMVTLVGAKWLSVSFAAARMAFHSTSSAGPDLHTVFHGKSEIKSVLSAEEVFGVIVVGGGMSYICT